MASVIKEQTGGQELRIIETGAGNTTITFLFLNPKVLVSICPDSSLKDRILNYCANNQIITNALDFRLYRSEIEFPKIALSQMGGNDKFDVALLDGGHGWPTVFVDFCYANMVLKKGGLLLIDDIQLYSVKELARLLSEQPEYECISRFQKIWIWKKKTESDFLPQETLEPYLKKMTEKEKAAGNEWTIDIHNFSQEISIDEADSELAASLVKLVADKKSSRGIIISFDEINDVDELTYLKGWAAISDNISTEGTDIMFLIQKPGDEARLIKPAKRRRPEITGYFKNRCNYDFSGFEVLTKRIDPNAKITVFIKRNDEMFWQAYR